MRYLSLIYLRHFGYAFQDKNSTHAPSAQSLEASLGAKGPPCTGTLAGRKPSQARLRKKRGLKRTRDDGEGDKSHSASSCPDVKKPRYNGVDTSLAGDTSLFEAKNSLGIRSDGEDSRNGAASYANKLHRYFKKTKRGSICYLSIRLTVAMIYLALLFSKQHVLLTDLTRWVWPLIVR